MSTHWHYSQDGAQYGPVEEREIIRQIQSSDLPPGTPVLPEGGDEWQPARYYLCFQVEIYPKRKAPVQTVPVAATAVVPTTPQYAQPLGVQPTAPAATAVVVRQGSAVPWMVAGMTSLALVGVVLWVFFLKSDGDRPDLAASDAGAANQTLDPFPPSGGGASSNAVAPPNKPGGTTLPPIPPPAPPIVPGQALPVTAQYLPANATIYFSINVEQLMKKGGYAELMKSPAFEAFAQGLANEPLEEIFRDPGALGIDLAQPIQIYLTMEPPAVGDPSGDPVVKGGLVAAVKDVAKVRGVLMGKMFVGEPRTIARNGYTAILPPDPGEGVVLGYSRDTLMLVFSSVEQNAPLMMGKLDARFAGRNAVTQDSNVAEMLRARHDLALWLDFTQVMKMVPEVDAADLFAQGLLGNMRYSVALNFEDGSVDADIVAYFDDALAVNFSKGGLDQDLLKLVPKDAILALAHSMNMKLFRKMIAKEVLPLLRQGEYAKDVQEFENAAGMTLEDLLAIPKGDFLLVFDGVKLDDQLDPMPQFLLGLTIDNKANLDQLLANPAIKGMLPTLNALGYKLTRNNNALFIHSLNHAPAVNAGRTFIPAAAGNLAMMRQDQGGFIQFDALATMMSQIDPTDPSLQQAAQILRKLDVLRFKATYGKQRQKMFVQLTFRDKRTNGIRQLIQFIMDFAEVADTTGATGPIAQANPRSRTARSLSREETSFEESRTKENHKQHFYHISKIH